MEERIQQAFDYIKETHDYLDVSFLEALISTAYEYALVFEALSK
jgi:hypothetical protein